MKKLIWAGLIITASAIHCACAEQSDEQARARQRDEQIRKNTSAGFVIVHYHLKKSQRPHPPAGDDFSYGYDVDDSDVLEKAMTKMTVDRIGVLISDSGLVLTGETELSPDVIERISVTTCDGRTLRAHNEKLLVSSPAGTVRIEEPLSPECVALKFSDLPAEPDITTKLYGVRLYLPQDNYYFAGAWAEWEGFFAIENFTAVRKRGNTTGKPDYFLFEGQNDITVVCGEDGSVFGVVARNMIELGSEAIVWKGDELLADEGIPRSSGEKLAADNFGKYLHQVRITFRPPPQEDDGYESSMFSSFFRRWDSRGGSSGRELFLYGLAIAPDKLLLPQALPQEMVAGIDTISAQVKSENVPAALAGVLRQLNATVITLSKAAFDETVKIDAAVTLPRCRPFWSVFASELAGMDLLVDCNRWIHRSKGYENKLFRGVENSIRSGSWLLDSQGRFAGLYTGVRYPWQRLKPYLLGSGYSDPDMYSFGSGGEPQIFDCAELAPILSSLPTNYDRYVRPLTKEDQNKRVWLGVEFTGISMEPAKQLNLRKQTQDGRLGLMINQIYPGSPAEKMGLAQGDVLLTIQTDQTPWPIELLSSGSSDYSEPDWEEGDMPDEFRTMGMQMPKGRPWPSRDNLLTRMLTIIGAGENVTLSYVHNGQILTKEFQTEISPPDSLSAKKYKDEKLGITVKNLTYEVRTGLRLGPQDEAIVVSKIEPGTPAALARIQAFELIRAVDGTQISSVDEFEAAIKQAQEDKKDSVRITVEWLGKTRLADLKFHAYAPAIKDMMKLIPPIENKNPKDEIQEPEEGN